MFPDRTANNSLNSTFMHTQKYISGTTTINHQGFQMQYNFTKEEVLTTITKQ